jgi:hypothetical protein
MAKTSIIQVLGQVLEITLEELEEHGEVTSERVNELHVKRHRLPVGKDFVEFAWGGGDFIVEETDSGICAKIASG